ncbi:MAG: 50S ribosomal protein L23 [Proteobacteria bacterium]|nr:50S ribosomal protein L23 [Pseudomonadota bacterium]MBU4469269.1 50S ribosomal protein L23 [Pseudomonadota bacterium]MCG2752299.1 50S ribosomal protein L23 [Desulfobacteraceae bacterium]
MIDYDIIKRPLITEKTNLQKEDLNQITFEVDPRANRIEIKKAVENIFSVSVLNVRTLNVKGKTKRRGLVLGRKKDWKKAVVTLKPGQRIDFFEGV